MLVNLNFKLKDIDGNELDYAAHALAVELSGQTPGLDPLKAWDWALSCKKEGNLTIDAVDAEALENVVRKSPRFTNLSIAQIVRAIKDAKEIVVQ